MRVLVCTVLGPLVLLCGGCQKPPTSVEISGATMGTRYHVTVARPASDIDIAALQREIDTELHRINAQMSTYLTDSEISKFNSQKGDEWFAVSPEFARVVSRARQFSELSDGAFDATVAPLVNRWSFGPVTTSHDVPSDEEIQALRESVDFRLVEVRVQPPALRKRRPEIQLDLSAIAKGFAVDRIAEILDSRGVGNFMVEIGGEIRVRGTSGRATAWTVGIEKPAAHERVLQRVVRVRDRALATSGDYRNFIEIDGRRYSHIIDPRTGYPVNHRLASVSVIGEDCLSADAWATALMVLGLEEGYALAEREGLAALFIEPVEGGFAEQMTAEFERLLAAVEEPSP